MIKIFNTEGSLLFKSNAKITKNALKKANRKGIDLRYADLQRTYLSGVDFLYENLQGTNFEWSNLEGANFEWANLRGVDFKCANLQSANFQFADLEGTSFRSTRIRGANFEGARNYYSFVAYDTSKRIVHCFKHKNTWMIKAGCFWGTLEELERKVKTTHNSKVYLANIEILKSLC